MSRATTSDLPPNTHRGPGQYIKSAAKAYAAYQGDLTSQYEILKDVIRSTMPRRKRGHKIKRRRVFPQRRRPMNNYLRPVKIPVRLSIPWERTSGTSGKWDFQIVLTDIVKNFVKTYDEFKILKLTLRWLPNNSTSSSGLTAAVLMDQKGFGNFGSASAESWFNTISSMPGSFVGNRHSSFSLNWKPTEPDSRQWRSYQRSETTYTVCRWYMADNGSEDSELGGIILCTGIAQGRGMYYNASTVGRSIGLDRLKEDEIDIVELSMN